ncbi:MAG TPA: hypothetical protein DDZ05_03650 [Candidatus Blackburnbacteria bacterium]|nr:hypothetical protein [Candidatus Blackburnbacteria bacterium]
MILTSQKSFSEWGSIFGDVERANATLGRLRHHSITITINGESYRIKDKLKHQITINLPNNPL